MGERGFDRDEAKNLANQQKHNVSFYEAQYAFLDSNPVIAEDLEHNGDEKRYYCFGRDQEGAGILRVRFAYRSQSIRIIGAGNWRKGKKVCEQANSV